MSGSSPSIMMSQVSGSGFDSIVLSLSLWQALP